jgi:hypothetical protein
MAEAKFTERREEIMSTIVKKTKAKILTFTHSTDTTSPMTFNPGPGAEVTARVMTAEDGAASRRLKVNSNSNSLVGSGRAVLAVTINGLTLGNLIIDIAAAPPPPATLTLTGESDDVDVD